MCHGLRLICFCKTRAICEIILKETLVSLEQVAPELVERIQGYRGGYSPQDRRRIESQLFKGELLCIIATNALELGIDIGSLDCVVHFGFPLNIASYKQQAGRAGRRDKDALSLLIADGNNALEQYYAKNPQELYSKNTENNIIENSHELILEAHLQCTAYEIPLTEKDFFYFGDFELVEDICEKFLLYDELRQVFLYFLQKKVY